MSIAKKILSYLEITGGGIMFYATGLFTIIYWAILITQFTVDKNAAFVPNILDDVYIITLGSYVGINFAEKAGSTEPAKRKGQVFFFGWIVLLAIGIVLVAFRVHGSEEVLDLIYPSPIAYIFGIFGATQVLKNAKAIAKKTREVFSKSSSPPKSSPDD